MATLPIKISLDHRHQRRHIISLDSHNLIIEVLNPRVEPKLHLERDIKKDDIVFVATFNALTDKQYEIYFRVLYPDNQKITGKPWTFDLFMDMAAQYLLQSWKLEHQGFAISETQERNMLPYMSDQGEIVL